jgi:hypothetical protein
MAEVTYFVALPFVAADDGVAAGEFGDARVIKKFGEVPDDLSTL